MVAGPKPPLQFKFILTPGRIHFAKVKVVFSELPSNCTIPEIVYTVADKPYHELRAKVLLRVTFIELELPYWLDVDFEASVTCGETEEYITGQVFTGKGSKRRIYYRSSS